jgi:Xaa-Pro aminopeptidase
MSGITRQEYTDRLATVRAAMEAEELDALIAYSTAKVTANVRYLTGYWVRFTGMQTRPDRSYYMFGAAAALVGMEGDPVVRTDQPWDVDRCRQVSIYPDSDFTSRFWEDFGPLCRERGYRRVGIDNWYLFPAHEYLALREAAPDTEFVGTELMSQVRRVKSPAEIEIMRRSAKVGIEAVTTALDAVKVGATEYEIALICEEVMRRGGDLDIAGQSIAGCGAKTATGSQVPSANPDNNKTIEAGEWYMLDVCPRVDGYAADISRHALAGDLSDLNPLLKRLYDATYLMSEEVRKAVRPGMSGWKLNEIAAAVAEDQGVREYKIDLLGHGVGLDIHDAPDYYYDDTPLSAGEIITIEPCLLMPGLGGTRIEDLVLVTEEGHEVLTETPRELVAHG